ncbi:hypothetical protein L596_003325 [Steinernema carpocapsae]|uniref:Uncharacterized protein n=1 Tax=Steinernema carpocapsae TaxID=34508 RepID=A0A4V6I7Z5_STECR|nr:hypothetical protein L596_003325 [Steinernema carpocapsae]
MYGTVWAPSEHRDCHAGRVPGCFWLCKREGWEAPGKLSGFVDTASRREAATRLGTSREAPRKEGQLCVDTATGVPILSRLVSDEN